MNTWLKELERALKRSFYPEEVEEIKAYYEEIIQERLSDGESLDDILSGYHIPDIVKTMTPEVILKRDKGFKEIRKSTKQLLILLLSTPVLIPLGIVYISVLIFLFSMLIVAGSLIFGSLVTFGGFLLDLLTTSQSIPNWFGMLGFGLMMVSLMLILSFGMIHGIVKLSKVMLVWVTKRVKGRNVT